MEGIYKIILLSYLNVALPQFKMAIKVVTDINITQTSSKMLGEQK